MKLRTKLAVSLIVITAAATSGIGWFAYEATATQLDSEINRSLDDVATMASTQLGDGRDGGHDHGPGADSSSSLVQRLGSDGSVLSSPNGLTVPVSSQDRAIAAGTAQGSVYRDVVIDSAPYRVLTTAAEHGGAVQAVRPLEERNNVLNALQIRIVLAAACVIALAGASGWFVARRITRRLSRLAAEAQAVAATGRLDLPIEANARDEAGQVAAAFADMLQVLNRSQLAQRRLAQDAGHELRTPLTSLRTNLDVLARHPELDGTQRDRIVADLHSESQELTVMVTELLALTAGDLDTQPAEHVTLRRAATHVVERAVRRTTRPITLHSDDSVVLASWTAVERAISNLIDNAVKFSPPGAPVRVEIEAGRVTVHDHGAGFATDDLPRAFDRFYRADAARALPGSGLGLAIVHDVATSFGGTAFAANEPSGGARVGFQLPLVPVPTSL